MAKRNLSSLNKQHTRALAKKRKPRNRAAQEATLINTRSLRAKVAKHEERLDAQEKTIVSLQKTVRALIGAEPPFPAELVTRVETLERKARGEAIEV